MRLKVSNVCQLLDKSKYPATHTQLGCTFTNNGDGSFTINGTIQNGGSWSNPLQQITQNLYGHKILFVTKSTSDIIRGEMKFTLQNGSSKWGTYNSIYTVIYDDYKYITIRIYMDNVDAGKTIDNATVKFQLFDLTEMYGAGNEPTTVAQFRQDFPNEMYEYSPVCWKKFRRLKYIANKEPVQLLDKSDFKTVVSKGVTATPNTTNGMWTISGAATASEYLQIGVYYPGTDFNIGDKLFLKHSNIDNSVYFPYAAWYDKDNKYLGEKDGDGTFSVTNPETAYIACYFTTRTVADINVTTQVQLFNLTRMYGKGNEPTAAEFVAQYPGFDYLVNKYNYLTLNRGKYIANKEPVQLLDKSKFYKTSVDYGVTWTNNGDGTITANGTATNIATYTLLVPNPRVIPGHKYLFISSITPQQADVATIITNIGGESGNGFIFTTDLTHINIYFYVRTNVTVSNVVFKPQLFDLTTMYGAGNEPTTVEQFRADFPNELYDYNPYNAITFR